MRLGSIVAIILVFWAGIISIKMLLLFVYTASAICIRFTAPLGPVNRDVWTPAIQAMTEFSSTVSEVNPYSNILASQLYKADL
jgi:hypothetical protein